MRWIVDLIGQFVIAPPAGEHGDRIIARLAHRQHGVVARRQLLRGGMTERAIRRRIESGHLYPVRHGVYTVGHRRTTRYGDWMAAVLACGPRSLLSHFPAGSLLGFLGRPREIHVTSASAHRHAGIRTHRARNLHPDDRSVEAGIPVTSPGRTLLDLAAVLPEREFARAYEEADRLGLVREQPFRILLERSNGHRGAGPLTALLDEGFLPPPTKLELERRFYELCRSAGLPLPEVNVMGEGRLVDAYWPAQRLVVELDSRTFHRTDAKVERDYETSTALKLAGYEVLRFTWKQVMRKQDQVVALVRLALRTG